MESAAGAFVAILPFGLDTAWPMRSSAEPSGIGVVKRWRNELETLGFHGFSWVFMALKARNRRF